MTPTPDQTRELTNAVRAARLAIDLVVDHPDDCTCNDCHVMAGDLAELRRQEREYWGEA